MSGSPRPFASFTAADHARIAYAQTAFAIAARGYEAVVPERNVGDHPFPPAILRTIWVLGQARRLENLAVILCHETGHTWDQIGKAFDITRQSAHQRFAPHVKDFHHDLATVLDQVKAGVTVPDAINTLPWRDRTGMKGYIVDTEWYAPRLDAWLVEIGDMPASMMSAFKPGALLARLSDQDTSVGYRSNGVRGPDAHAPRCPFTADYDYSDDSDSGVDDEPGLYYVCLHTAGHGGLHKLAVSGGE